MLEFQIIFLLIQLLNLLFNLLIRISIVQDLIPSRHWPTLGDQIHFDGGGCSLHLIIVQNIVPSHGLLSESQPRDFVKLQEVKSVLFGEAFSPVDCLGIESDFVPSFFILFSP